VSTFALFLRVPIENNKFENHSVNHNKMCPFLRQGIYIYVGHYFLWNTVGLHVIIHQSCLWSYI